MVIERQTLYAKWFFNCLFPCTCLAGQEFFPKGKVTKKNLARFIKEARRLDPTLSHEDAACLAATYLFENEKHSRLFYRVSAVRSITGSKVPIPQLNKHLQAVYDTMKDKYNNVAPITKDGSTEVPMKPLAVDAHYGKEVAVFQFASPTAVVLENAGKVEATVVRTGNTEKAFQCEIETLNRTAIANIDYIPLKETLNFEAGETEKKITIQIIDNKQWNPDKVFLVRLSWSQTGESVQQDVVKGPVCILTVTIVDDDEPGIIAFGQRMFVVAESSKKIVIPVLREQGADGDVKVKWKAVDGTAKRGRDYLCTDGELTFGHGIISQDIEIEIVDDVEEEKDEYFEVVLMEPKGGAKIGHINRTMITITNDDDYNTFMGSIMKKVNINRDNFRLRRDEWIEQIKSAITLKGEIVEGEEEKLSKLAYFLHVLSFGWKVLFSFVPPTSILGGWLTFFISLTLIGVITAVVGDVAGTLGCLINLKDSVTAITLVALGTSLPDLFASRTAARMERFADNAIGNVTGSNSVNVFLGLGLPWLIAAIYWNAQGERFEVRAGSLGFSVGLYTAVSLIAIGVLIVRRMMPIFGPGELGGPPKFAFATCFLFVSLWVFYVILSSLQAYGIIAA